MEVKDAFCQLLPSIEKSLSLGIHSDPEGRLKGCHLVQKKMKLGTFFFKVRQNNSTLKFHLKNSQF
jgi:hypothetical protein